jgi:DNA-directed RNA polymerase specialized sigma24 family protein
VGRGRGASPADETVERADGVLFGQLYRSLRRFAAAVRPEGVDPDDLVQEALARTLAIRPLSECDDPGAYLRRAIVRVASNHRRSFGRRDRAYTRSYTTGVDTDAYPSDLADLRRLPPLDRAVLYLSIIERWSAREIAVALHSTEQAVRARSSRALRKLRTELTDEHLEITDA